jgi:phenylpyruvate tautomerase PptA (4-oxalocrotonate tautomerase family)
MPILDVEIVGTAAAGAAQAVAEAAAQVFDAAPGTTWVKLREIDRAHYAENSPGPSPSPVFVRVLKRSAPADAGREHWALARAIGAALGIEHRHVHITYEPPAAGRQSFGGEVVE